MWNPTNCMKTTKEIVEQIETFLVRGRSGKLHKLEVLYLQFGGVKIGLSWDFPVKPGEDVLLHSLNHFIWDYGSEEVEIEYLTPSSEGVKVVEYTLALEGNSLTKSTAAIAAEMGETPLNVLLALLREGYIRKYTSDEEVWWSF